jgi:hypothetical protein
MRLAASSKTTSRISRARTPRAAPRPSEEELENAGLALFLQERLATSEGKRLSAGDFLTEIGMGEFVEQLPGG